MVSILDFGAKSGLDSLQTKSVQNAIDYCFRTGGGEVEIPKGSFLIGGIRLRSNVTLYLRKGARLIASRNPDDYELPSDDGVEKPIDKRLYEQEEKINGRSVDGLHYFRRWYRAIIKAYEAENIAIVGEEDSYIDGRDCYDALGEEGYRGPHAICFCKCKNVKLDGYTVKDSGNWAHSIWESQNIRCKRVTVLAGHDGLDILGCDDVRVEDCTFFSGDDAIAGFDNQNVVIENNRFSSACSAFRFSGTGVLIRNCQINGNSPYLHRYTLSQEEKETGVLLTDEQNPNHRYRMKSFYSYYADYRLEIRKMPANIVVENCTVDSPEKFFHFNFSGSECWSTNKPLTEIVFKNIVAKNLRLPIVAYGEAENPLQITFENICFEIAPDYADDCLFKTANLKRMELKNCTVKGFQGKTTVKNYGVQRGEILSDSFPVSVVETDEAFIVESI